MSLPVKKDKTSRPCGSERGSTITPFALAIVALFFLLGLSVDLGSTYVLRSRLSESVDAGALAGARNSSKGDAAIRRAALKAASNGYRDDQAVNFSVDITMPAPDTKRVSVVADTGTRTRFAVLMGEKSLDVVTAAETTRYPLDMSLVLDRSVSLERNKVVDRVQEAARGFLEHFDETLDQIGIVSYSTAAQEHLALQKRFQSPAAEAIGSMTALSDTNIQEGLRVAKSQMDAADIREGVTRVVVLFTDGRPTAFRETLTFLDTSCQGYDGIIATYIAGQSYRGLFRSTDARKVVAFDDGCAVTTADNRSRVPSPVPAAIFDGSIVSGDNIRSGGVTKAERVADEIRAAGYTIYTVGLGSRDSNNPTDSPDLGFLRRIANAESAVDQNQPRGETYFAPSTDELDEAFAELADRLLTRIIR